MTDFNVFIVFGCMVLVLCCLVKKLLQWLWWLGSAWRELVTDMNVAVSQSTTLLSTVGGLTQSIKAQRNYPCSIYLCLWYCVCSQYLTSVGCYRLVTAFPPPLLITLNMFHQMVVKKKGGKKRQRFCKSCFTFFLWATGKWITTPTCNVARRRLL